MQFVYFIPGLSGPASREQLEAAGLGYAFPKGQEFHCAGDSEGPAGMGALVSADAKALRFKKSDVRWEQTEKIFVGIMPSQTPKPAALRNEQSFVDGHAVVLGDKNSWTIPVIRFSDGSTSLPCVLRRQASGSHRYEVRSEFRKVFQMCDDLVDGVLQGKAPAFTPDQVAEFSAVVLGINYRISEVEISMLELIDTANIKQVANAVLDVPKMLVLFEEFKKKLQTEPFTPGPASGTGASA